MIQQPARGGLGGPQERAQHRHHEEHGDVQHREALREGARHGPAERPLRQVLLRHARAHQQVPTIILFFYIVLCCGGSVFLVRVDFPYILKYAHTDACLSPVWGNLLAAFLIVAYIVCTVCVDHMRIQHDYAPFIVKCAFCSVVRKYSNILLVLTLQIRPPVVVLGGLQGPRQHGLRQELPVRGLRARQRRQR